MALLILILFTLSLRILTATQRGSSMNDLIMQAKGNLM